MTHFNGTMKNCNGFSTPTKEPTSRMGRCDFSREGLSLQKAVKKKRSVSTILRSADSREKTEKLGFGKSGPEHVWRGLFFVTDVSAAAEFTICLTCLGPLTHVS